MTLARGLSLLALLAAAPVAAALPTLPELTLDGTDGRSHALRETVRDARFTVFVFFSATCPCMASHDEGLVALAQAQRARGVQVFLIDSEVGDAAQRDREEVVRRHYPFPILADPGARLAKAFGALFATTTAIVDQQGRVRYFGGIDASRRHPLPPGQAFLDRALSALHAGKEPEPAETKSFGCFLRTS